MPEKIQQYKTVLSAEILYNSSGTRMWEKYFSSYFGRIKALTQQMAYNLKNIPRSYSRQSTGTKLSKTAELCLCYI